MSSDAPQRGLLLTIPGELAGLRLDQALARLLPEHSRNRLQAWIREGRVELEGETVDDVKLRVVGEEELLVVPPPPPEVLAAAAQNIALDVIYEDECLAVIHKPAGLVVHPGSGNWDGTLLNALLFRWPDSAAIPRAGIVHRLDKDTSGLMVVARSLEAQTDLVRQLQARSVKRHYYALLWGVLEADGEIDAPIGRHPTQRTRMAVSRQGREARTRYRVLERFAATTWVECALETGRTHQIRVHMNHIGYPLVGDPVYGGRRPALGLERQALHAFRLGLVHPHTGAAMNWELGLPEDLARLLGDLRANAGGRA